ncbi:MAG: hypothetical protein GTO45_01970 [Candidatus Aminicenantes bacterium]|nr:hypothetical protein [Candidatus Aminicenantes bacterium]NIM80338.1 hypothetical protein [Candidatus Aminicenantes bacterium]NIN16829.1 hypothetical protein [Candidatus Aminicenantes bacterium]NIN40685.1 hypothetical protein [Candidatus Aminicenantes bacterium]NIN83508.1 hypothetical protein [Candidatus Aminicenantes bacterium]
MCLILFVYKFHPRYKLILAANRDEYYNRPSTPAQWWENNPSLLAGKDLKAGGTWMGITKNGKIAAVTNYRGTEPLREDALSRGTLVSQYLLSEVSPGKYLENLCSKGSDYNGFNVIMGDMDNLYYYSNMKRNEKNSGISCLKPGIYGLSNAFLDTPWPKIVRGKQMLEQHVLNHPEVPVETIFSILNDREIAPDDKLPDTGVGIEIERVLSPLFIKTPEYGTRSSTVVLVDNDNHVTFVEHSFVPPAKNHYEFTIK